MKNTVYLLPVAIITTVSAPAHKATQIMDLGANRFVTPPPLPW